MHAEVHDDGRARGESLWAITADGFTSNEFIDVAGNADPKGVAGREASAKVENAIAKNVPWLIGGAADLAPSTKTRLTFEGAGDFTVETATSPTIVVSQATLPSDPSRIHILLSSK